ncbi:SPOSA6832_04196, partial [Sporobolomyces salmonicolor]
MRASVTSRLASGSSIASSSRMRPTPSTAFLAPSSAATPSAADTANAVAFAAVFRTLNFGGSVPIEVVLAEEDLPKNADRSIEAYYVQAPRISYLPLLLAQVRKQFVDLVLDESTSAALREDQLWFEVEGGGGALKHWPIGLLYDYHHALSHPSLPPPSTTSPYTAAPSSALPSSLASVFAPLSSPSALTGSNSLSPSFPASLPLPSYPHSPPVDSQSTLRARPSGGSSAFSAPPPRAPSRSSTRSVSEPGRPPPPPVTQDAVQPWRITLHLKDPPVEQLLVSNRVEDCRVGFMAMVKEADYVRWGNVKRVTNLRKEQQDNLWEGVVQNNFDKYWTVASKLVPLPSLSGPSSSSPSATRSATPSSGGSGSAEGRLPDANSVRSVPIRVYLPEGAPAMQSIVAPMQDGAPTTLHSALSALLPLLFPSLLSAPALAHPLIQGILVPLESEIGWLGACMAGADGWVNVVVAVGEGL